MASSSTQPLPAHGGPHAAHAPPAHPAFPAIIFRPNPIAAQSTSTNPSGSTSTPSTSASSSGPSLAGFQRVPKPPTTHEGLVSLLRTHGHATHDIVGTLVPLLLAFVDGKGQGQGEGGDGDADAHGHADAGGHAFGQGQGQSRSRGGKYGDFDGGAGEKDYKKKQAAKTRAEKIMSLPGWTVEALPDEEVRMMAAVLVFTLTARMRCAEDGPPMPANTMQQAMHLVLIGQVDQLVACGPRLATFAWGLVDLGRRFNQLEEVFAILDTLLQRVCRPGLLSGAHAAFLHVCLAEGRYDAGERYIDALYVDVKTMRPTSRDVITFFHHAGLMSAAQRLWERAFDMYSMAVSVPTNTASAIQISAAKRAYMCGLLHNGKVARFAPYTSPPVHHALERHAKIYVRLANAYAAGNWDTVGSFGSTKEFKDDCNLGLFNLIVESIPARRVVLLRETHSRMTLEELCGLLQHPADAEGQKQVRALLEDMAARGTCPIDITPHPSAPDQLVVAFPPETDAYNSPEALLRLRRANALAEALDAEMRLAVREVQIGSAYLKKQTQLLEKSAPGNGRASAVDVDEAMDGFSGSGGVPGLTGVGGGKGKGGKGFKVRGAGGNVADLGF